MKDLSNLSPAQGSHRTRKRLGRGIGSGLGKTAGKGHKGQKARKSGGIRPGFEGGQTPLYKRLPKVGFTNGSFRNEYNIIKVEHLNTFDDGAVVNGKALEGKGLLKRRGKPVKILGNGELKKKLVVEVEKVTSGARAAIEKLGGSIKEL